MLAVGEWQSDLTRDTLLEQFIAHRFKFSPGGSINSLVLLVLLFSENITNNVSCVHICTHSQTQPFTHRNLFKCAFKECGRVMIMKIMPVARK